MAVHLPRTWLKEWLTQLANSLEGTAGKQTPRTALSATIAIRLNRELLELQCNFSSPLALVTTSKTFN